MKIISGEFKGRVVKGYDINGTRPTMDRVKESLFGMIQGNIKDSIVLDLFAGTGNLGLEAISNGAKFCYFNDNNIKCTSIIEKFCNQLMISEKVKILKMHYDKALHFLLDNHVKFDIVFLDPPYKMECLNEVVDFMLSNNMINKNGIIVCEVDTLYLNIDRIEKIKEKKYGNKFIVIYKNSL